MGKLWVVVDQITLLFPSADGSDTQKTSRNKQQQSPTEAAHKTPKHACEVGYKVTKADGKAACMADARRKNLDCCGASCHLCLLKW